MQLYSLLLCGNLDSQPHEVVRGEGATPKSNPSHQVFESAEPTRATAPQPRGNHIGEFDELERYFNAMDLCRYSETRQETFCASPPDLDKPFTIRRPTNNAFEFAYGNAKGSVDVSSFMPQDLAVDGFSTGFSQLYGRRGADGKSSPRVFLMEVGGTLKTGGPAYLNSPNSSFHNDSYGAYLIVKVDDSGICVTGGIRTDIPYQRTAELAREGRLPSRTGNDTFHDVYRARVILGEPVVNRRLLQQMREAERTRCDEVDVQAIREDLRRPPV